MAKECTVRTGKLRPRRLLMIRMAMITPGDDLNISFRLLSDPIITNM